MRDEHYKAPSGHGKPKLLTFLTAAFLITAAVPRAPHTNDRYIPEQYLDALRTESEASPLERRGVGFGAAHYMRQENEAGMNIAPGIRQLADPRIRPDLAEEQIYFFLGMSGRGNALSREERKAVAEVARSWPDHFEPYFTSPGEHPDTRTELIRELRAEHPALQRYLPEEEPNQEIASRTP